MLSNTCVPIIWCPRPLNFWLAPTLIELDSRKKEFSLNWTISIVDHFLKKKKKTVYTLKVSTNLKYLSWTKGCHNLPSITSLPSTTSTTPSTSTSTISPSPMATPDLAVTLWRAYPDTAVFDWLITLQVRKRPIAARKEAQHIRELF